MVTIADEPVIIEPEAEPEPEPEPELEPAEPEESVEPPTPKKKPGRPVGSKSKEPGKPRAKRVKIVEEAVPHSPPPPVEQPSRPIPTRRDSDSALMLEMLSQHAKERQNRKADLWKSWFR